MASLSYLPRARKLSETLTWFESAEMAEESPALYALLCSARDEAGAYRKGSTLMLFADDGRLKATITDPATGQVWFATLTGWRGCLKEIESLLQKGSGDWRAQRNKR